MKRKSSVAYTFLISVILILVNSCGSQSRDRENYGDLTSPPGAIILDNPEKHMGGYGRNECLVCHNVTLNIHRRDGANIDVEALNASIRNGGESLYCLRCHGRNGTPE